jgi:uncharacterized HAD superfamily protein
MTPIVCFDIDGVLATGTEADVYSDKAGWAYEKCTPLKKVILLVWDLRNQGVTVILHTARPKRDRKKTEQWLFENGVVYDELVMDKPFAHVYVDDRNFPTAFDPAAEGTRSALLQRLRDICYEGSKNLK